MRTVALSMLLAASAAFAGAANAQEAPAPPAYEPSAPFSAGNSGADPGAVDNWHWESIGGVTYRNPVSAGVAALEANDFAKAEEIFSNSLRYYRSDPTFRFYMGVAKMNLGKWDEARRYLRTAARELRKLPDPKGHLGVTYAKLGDIDAANAQRASLVKMAEACKGTCKLSPYIVSGIQMIDEALAEGPSSF